MYCYGEATRLAVRQMPVQDVQIEKVPSISIKNEVKKIEGEMNTVRQPGLVGG